MNKKFLSGAIFGLSLGICIAIATPMIGATNNAKNIVVKKGSFKGNNQSKSAADAKPDVDGNADIKEAVAVLKEINQKLKENSDQNQQIISGIKTLILRTEINPGAEEPKK